jgi:Cu/Ag efflux protein CusF
MRSLFRRAVLGATLLSTFAVSFAADALSEGTVKKIDKAAGRVTLAHGPLVNLDMPGMTMPFAVREPAWLDKLKPGQKIRFRAEEGKDGYVVVLIEPAK